MTTVYHEAAWPAANLARTCYTTDMPRWFRHLPVVWCVVVLTAMFSIQFGTARQESQTMDEAVHLSAGFSYLKTRDFRLNPEHPPLIKLIAALPLLFTHATLPTNDSSWWRWDQYLFGDVFLYQNTLAPQTLLLLGRLPIMLLSVLLGVWIFRASRELFGPWGGALSVTLYALDPGFIAHGHYITTDLGFTAFAFLTVVRLVKLLDAPNRRNAIWFGLALLLAGLSKFSGLAFVLAIIITLGLFKLREHHHPALRFRRMMKAVLIALPFAAIVIWTIYGFDVRRRADDPRIAQLYAQRADYLTKHDPSTLSPLLRFVLFTVGNANQQNGSWLERTSHLPIPGYAFFRGLITVVGHSVGGQQSYLLGEYRDLGWWYYFPIAFLTKTPLPTLAAGSAIVVIVMVAAIRRRRAGATLRELARLGSRPWLLFLTVPSIFFLISMSSHLNLGWRHIMPVYPFLFVLAGVLTTPAVFPDGRWRRSVPLTLGLAMVFIQVRTYPNEIGYFNALAGGSWNGPDVLLDSNLDWGQDVFKLGPFLRQHQLESIPFLGYGRVPAERYAKVTHLPTTAEVAAAGSVHGFVAISVGQLMRKDGEYGWLRPLKPYAILGSGIYVYHLP